MSTPFSFGNLEFNFGSGQSSQGQRPDPETPFRVAIMGDFSGRANRGISQPLTARDDLRPIAVDCDSLDGVMAKLGVALYLPVPGKSDAEFEVLLREIEDFHPDRLYDKVELFQALRKTRRDLLNPATFDQAAAEVTGWAQQAQPADGGDAVAGGEASAVDAPDSGGDTFAQLMGKPQTLPQRGPDTRVSASLDVLLRQVVGPCVVHPNPQQDQLVAAVDDATGRLMRAVLHNPDFQAVEAAWRGLDFLVRNLETDEQLRLFVIDISQAELAADMASTDDLQSTGLHHLLVEQSVGSAGGKPWAAFAGVYTFGPTAEDAQTLGRLAKIAAQAVAPLIAGADPGLLGCRLLADSPDPNQWTQPLEAEATEAWAGLRKLPQAAYVGLAIPRFLLRLPYGEDTDEIERFTFEEIEDEQSTGPYLWGNPALICAYLLGHEFGQCGWDFTPGVGHDVNDMPAHTYKQDGESKMTPCAEAWLTDRAADQILAKGLMPLLSIQGRDAVRLVRFQSIAEPSQNLAGRWG